MMFGTPCHHALLTKALTECVTLTECGWGTHELWTPSNQEDKKFKLLRMARKDRRT
jgi:hypothetical protein